MFPECLRIQHHFFFFNFLLNEGSQWKKSSRLRQNLICPSENENSAVKNLLQHLETQRHCSRQQVMTTTTTAKKKEEKKFAPCKAHSWRTESGKMTRGLAMKKRIKKKHKKISPITRQSYFVGMFFSEKLSSLCCEETEVQLEVCSSATQPPLSAGRRTSREGGMKNGRQASRQAGSVTNISINHATGAQQAEDVPLDSGPHTRINS